MKPRYKEIRTLPNGRAVYVYDDAGIRKRKQIKDSKVSTIKRSIGEIISAVENDAGCGSEPAAVVGVMLCTYERVGNEASAAQGHYGASNLEKRHVIKMPGGLMLDYIAKSGVRQRKPIVDKLICKEIENRIRGKSPNDRIFSCTPKEVNDYLRQFNITSKDIRTFAANKFMADALLEAPIHETKTGRNKTFKAKLKEVAEVIGHKPSTLNTMYLSDSLKKNYLESGKVKKLVGRKNG